MTVKELKKAREFLGSLNPEEYQGQFLIEYQTAFDKPSRALWRDSDNFTVWVGNRVPIAWARVVDIINKEENPEYFL